MGEKRGDSFETDSIVGVVILFSLFLRHAVKKTLFIKKMHFLYNK